MRSPARAGSVSESGERKTRRRFPREQLLQLFALATVRVCNQRSDFHFAQLFAPASQRFASPFRAPPRWLTAIVAWLRSCFPDRSSGHFRSATWASSGHARSQGCGLRGHSGGTNLDHNQTASAPGPRHSSQRAHTTNDPLALPAGLLLTTQRGRRWRDLAEHYSALIGSVRMKREDIRSRVRGVIWLTLQIEQAHSDQICDKPINPQLLLHMQQEQRAVLNELDLDFVEEPEVRTRDYTIFATKRR